MALEKQTLSINFSQGLDLKTDDKQVAPGKFLVLENSIFTKGGLLQKRNGYLSLSDLSDDSFNHVTTFNGNLTAIGSRINAYSSASASWVNKGSLQPLSLSTLPLVRSSTNQSQADSAVASNGLVCTVFTDDLPAGGLTTPSYKFVVADSVTGQNVVQPTVISVTSGTVSGSPRVFCLGKYFVVVITNLISSTYHLQYFTINITTLAVSAEVDVSSQYTPSSTVAFDGFVANNTLYLAWNGSDVGGAIRMRSLSSTLILSTAVAFATYVATLVSVCADTTAGTPVIYVSFYDSATSLGYTLAVNQGLVTVLAPTALISATTVLNITSSAQSGVCTALYEVSNAYTYDAAIKSNYIVKRTMTQAGVAGTATTVSRSVGLASKSFILDGSIYVLGAYSSTFQPSYFLLDLSGNVLSRIAYQNGSQYYTVGLPSVTVTDSVAQCAYFFKDLIQSVNKENGAAQAAGVYSQTGINLVSFDMGVSPISTSEIGNNLNISGGFLWGYDGNAAVENGFFLYPDNLKVTTSTGVTPTGDTTNGSKIITNVSAMASVGVGCTISGTGIPGGATITNVSGSTITISANATATGTGVTLTIDGSIIEQTYYYCATYEWADNQGNVFRSAPSIPVVIATTTATSINTINVPTLRLTYKTANPAKIVIYRWSTAQPIFYQVTSITSPILNSKTTDSVSFVDSQADTQIIGNNILYTTGGVVENAATPATSVLTLFKSRQFLIDAEDDNLLWYSKQVIQGTPVEMSDLFTLYVAPTAGAQGSTGGMRALSAMDDKLIIFKQDAIYYITGNGPDNTGANNDFSEPVFITATVGCSNQNSIVFIPQGLMFQSDKGIWLLGRDLTTSYIGAPVEDFNRYTVKSAVNIPGTNQVRFTLSNGVTLMYDYFFGQWGTFVGVPAISSTLYESLHTFINEFGQVFQESPGLYLDGSRPVLMRFSTGWFNLAGLQGFQRAYWLSLLGTYISPHRLSVGISYDYSYSPEQVSVINPENYSPAYGGDSLYGGSEVYGGPVSLEQWEVFFARQKCEAFQITVSEIYDASFGVMAGAGLTLSGINLVVGLKGANLPLKARQSVG